MMLCKNNLFAIVLFFGISNAYSEVPVGDLSFIEKADHAFSVGKYNEALINYQHAVSDAEDKLTIYIKIAQCFKRLNIIHSAHSVVDKILSISPDHIEALFIKGELMEVSNEYDQALAIFQQVESIDPSWNASYFAQARVLGKMGREEESAQVLNKIKD